MNVLVQADESEQVGSGRRPQDLQKLCCSKKGKVSECVLKAVTLAVDPNDDTVVVSSPGANNIVAPRVGVLSRQLPCIRSKVILFTAKFFDLEKAREKTEQKHEHLLKNVLTKTKTSKQLVVDERGGAFFY